jgi:hypothetical protein
VLPDIVVRLGLLVDPVALETAIRHVLLVQAPADTLGLKQVHDSLDAGPDALEAIVGYAIGATSSGCYVVGLERNVRINTKSNRGPN